MANVKNYGLIGVGNNVQLGKLGPKLQANSDTGVVSITTEGGALTVVRGANATGATDFVTKAQLDAGAASDGFALELGNISASGDGSWTDGAVQTITNSTKVAEGIDKLNEALENVRNNTFVKTVDAATDVAAGGAPLTATLTLTTVGNPNRYTIDWGDGTTDTATSDSTPSHTYSNNANSPFDVTVTAFNNAGSGEGSTASVTKNNLITLYTADPVSGFLMKSALSGGSTITSLDDGATAYFDNETTNIGSADATYRIEWGDGSANSSIAADTDAGGTQGARLSHVFTTSTETDREYNVKLTLLSHTTADPSVIPNNATSTIKVYDTHTPTVSLSSTNVINEESTGGGVVTFTNNTENTIGSNATFGIYYVYNWGDGTTSTVSTGGGGAGDTGQTINHTYSLSGSDQASGENADYTGNIQVYSAHTSSPFTSSNFSVHLEPDVRANLTATSVSKALKSSNDNDRTLYAGTDLSGTNRAIVTVDNTSQNGNVYTYTWGDGSSDANITSGAGDLSSNITHDYASQTPGSYSIQLTATGTPDITAQTDSESTTVTLESVPSAPTSVSGKSLTLSTSSQDTSKLAHGATDFTGGSLAVGSSLNSTTARRYDSTTSVSTNLISNAYRSDSGTASALIDGTADGTKAFSTSTGETGTFTSLVITAEGEEPVAEAEPVDDAVEEEQPEA